MRRKDREIKDLEQMLNIMKSCGCCRIGLVDKDEAYIVPMNFGYEESEGNITLYFHCARDGRKLDLLPKQKNVAFEMDSGHELMEGENACQFSYFYRCIMGKGKIEILEDDSEKLYGLQRIMAHYSGEADWKFRQEAVNRIAVLKLSVEEWSCKEHGKNHNERGIYG